MKVFVYGTLKRGFSANSMLQGARYLGEGVIEGYDMYDLGSFPAIIEGEGKVRGEVYEVDKGTLNLLDFYEGVPNLYVRKKVKVKMENGKIEDAYAYIFRNKRYLKRYPKAEKIGDVYEWRKGRFVNAG